MIYTFRGTQKAPTDMDVHRRRPHISIGGAQTSSTGPPVVFRLFTSYGVGIRQGHSGIANIDTTV